MSAGPNTLNAYISIVDCVSTLRQALRESRARILTDRKEHVIDSEITRIDAMEGMLKQDEKWLREMVDKHSPGGGW